MGSNNIKINLKPNQRKLLLYFYLPIQDFFNRSFFLVNVTRRLSARWCCAGRLRQNWMADQRLHTADYHMADWGELRPVVAPRLHTADYHMADWGELRPVVAPRLHTADYHMADLGELRPVVAPRLHTADYHMADLGELRPVVAPRFTRLTTTWLT